MKSEEKFLYIKELEEWFEKLKSESDKQIIFKNFKLFDTSFIEKDNFHNKVIPEKFLSDLCEKLKDNKFILYGAGIGGFLFFNAFCKKYNLYPFAIVDKNFKGQEKYFDIPAYPPLEFNFTSDLFVVITITKPFYVKEIIEFLSKFISLEKIITIPPEIWGYLYLSLSGFKRKDNYYLKPVKFYLENKDKIIKTLKFFHDKTSLELYIKLIKSYTSGNFYSLPFSPADEQYFPRDINLLKGYKRFIHCGAFIGDTIRQLMQIIGKIEALVCFEPDIINFNELKKFLNYYAKEIADYIIAFPCAVWKENTFLNFTNGMGGGSCIDENGEFMVYGVAIDDVLPNFNPTYITMDIEGAELEALEGTKKTIKECLPDLAISVYHKPEHLWEIPLYIKSLNPSYKFFLRNYTGGILETILYCTM